MDQSNEKLLPYTLISVVGALIIITWMRYAQVIIVPFLFAAFITVILSSPMSWLKRKKVPFFLSITIVLLSVFGILSIIFVMLGSSVDRFTQNLPTYQQQLQQTINHVLEWFGSKHIHLSKTGIMSALNPNAALSLMNTLLTSLGNVFSKVFLILFTVILMLVEAWYGTEKIESIYGDRSESILQKTALVINNIRGYMSIKAIMSLITATLITTGLVILGLEYAILWGTLAFLLNFIPNIGSIIAAVPAILFALLKLGWTKTILVAALYLVINMIIGNFIEPKFIGSKVGLSTLVVFLSLIFWGWVLGPVGMILSVPLTMLIKITLLANLNSSTSELLVDIPIPVSDNSK